MPGAPVEEGLVAPLDRARGALYRAAVRVPAIRRVIARRELRLAVQSTLGVAAALAVATVAPVLLLAVSPVILGVPHVAADVRYLVVRRGLPRAWIVGCVAACGLLFAARLGAALAPGRFPIALVEGALAFTWLFAAAIGGAACARSWRRAALLVPPLAALAFACAQAPRTAQVVFAHLHNAIAIVVWVALFRRRALAALAPIAIVIAGAALLASGATIDAARATGGVAFAGLSLDAAAARIVPFGPADLAVRLTLLFAFLQAVHYAVWLVWIPQDELAGEGTRTYRQTVRGLGRDFGRLGLCAIAVSTLFVMGAAVLDLHGTRTLYLSLASFHGVLEVATLVFFVAAARPRPARAAAR